MCPPSQQHANRYSQPFRILFRCGHHRPQWAWGRGGARPRHTIADRSGTTSKKQHGDKSKHGNQNESEFGGRTGCIPHPTVHQNTSVVPDRGEEAREGARGSEGFGNTPFVQCPRRQAGHVKRRDRQGNPALIESTYATREGPLDYVLLVGQRIPCIHMRILLQRFNAARSLIYDLYTCAVFLR